MWQRLIKILRSTIKGMLPLIISILIGVVVVKISNYINVKPDKLVFISIIYYIGLIYLFIINPKIRWYLLPFVLLTIPPNMDDIFPSTYIGYIYERGAARIPIFGNVDISLILLYFILKNEKRISLDQDNKNSKTTRVLKFTSLILIAVSILSAVRAFGISDNYHNAAIVKGTFMFFRMYFIQLIISLLFKSKNNINEFIVGASLSSVLLFATALYNTLSKGASRLQGAFGMNVYGNFMVLLSVLFLAAFNINENKGKRKIMIIGILVSILQLFLTGTRMAVLALGFGIVIYLLLSRIKIRKKIIIVASIVISIGLGSIMNLSYFNNAIERIREMVLYKEYLAEVELSTTTTLGTRLILWNATATMIKEHLYLGVGPSMWNFERYNYGVHFNVLLDTHNGYLQILSEYGMLAFVTYLVYLIYCLSKSIKSVKASKDINNYNFFLGITVAIITWLLTEFTNAGITKPQIQVFVWGMFTMLVVNQANSYEKDEL